MRLSVVLLALCFCATSGLWEGVQKKIKKYSGYSFLKRKILEPWRPKLASAGLLTSLTEKQFGALENLLGSMSTTWKILTVGMGSGFTADGLDPVRYIESGQEYVRDEARYWWLKYADLFDKCAAPSSLVQDKRIAPVNWSAAYGADDFGALDFEKVRGLAAAMASARLGNIQMHYLNFKTHVKQLRDFLGGFSWLLKRGVAQGKLSGENASRSRTAIQEAVKLCAELSDDPLDTSKFPQAGVFPNETYP